MTPSTMVAVVVLLLVIGATAFAAPAGGNVTVFRDPAVAQTVFAAGEVRKALEAELFVVTEKHLDELPRDPPAGGKPSGTGAGVRIVIAVTNGAVTDGAATDSRSALRLEGDLGVDALAEQGYAILLDDGPTCYLAIGADPAGAMYAGLDLAEQIRIGGGLAAVRERTAGPAILRRGIKFNIPLDARTPGYDDTGDAAQKNIVEMWEFDFWREFLDEMARHRFNTLTLWNPHPFPSIVKCPGYPDCTLDDVCVPAIEPVYKSRAWRDPQFVSPKVLANLKVVKKVTMDEKIAHWRRVLAHARDRSIDVYWITWNVIMNSAEGKYGITDAQDNPATIAYLRECVRETVLTYPLLTGIGVTAGEHMRGRNDEYDREKWLWRTYGLGIMDARKERPGRQVRFIHRVWQSGLGKIMTDFAANYPDTFEVGFKYARARLYSSPKPPFVKKLLAEMKRHDVKGWWNLRNDDIFNFRWGDPDYVREFLGNLPPKELTAGFHMGSDGYVWAREHTSTEPETPRQLEIRKHWYRFMLWGRLGYDPTLDRSFFVKVLATRFPDTDAGTLYDAWQAASRIIPQVNRFHWRNWDFMWAVEICSDQRKGFHTVEDFVKCPTMDASGQVSVSDYVERSGANRAIGGTGPLEVADRLDAHAGAALDGVAALRGIVTGGVPTAAADSQVRRDDLPRPLETRPATKELRRTLADIEAMSHLGRYYAAKIRGAVALEQAGTGGKPDRRAEAVTHLTDAVGHWERYAGTASKLYRPQLLARTRRTDWMKLLDEVKKDVEIARRRER